MWQHAGLLRDRQGLHAAVRQLEAWCAAAGGVTLSVSELRRVRTLLTVGLLIATAALRREESRGGHFRADFPARDDVHWGKHVSDVQQRD